MTLGEKQRIFTQNLAKLIIYINLLPGYHCVLGEVQRSKEVAEANAKSGKGISKSLHIVKLAGDVAIFKDNHYLTDTDDYEFAGRYWKELHPDNRWGGDFSRPRDGNHFSMTYEGRA